MAREVVLRILREHPEAEVRWVDAASLHIVENLSCYAGGERNCGDPKSGPYRCWAHHNSVKDPSKYGGVDQMPVIYDGLAWCDIALFTTSVRWGSHTAVMQRVIERMNTLTGRTTTWGEAEPLAGKRVGVIVGGFNWRSRQVGIRLAEILQELGVGFEVPEEGILTWQLESDPYVEQEEAIRPEAIDWLRSPAGIGKVRAFVHSYLRGPVDL
jgi:multimeric flavodoxin WrbA